MELERSCTLYIHSNRADPPSVTELQKKIESLNESVKAEGMQELIIAMCQGEAYTRLLMPVIRYAMPSSDKRVKKLTQLYLEIAGKCRPDGTLKEEMILVCNALRNDLMSPNEYVRGSTLRLLCKIHHLKLLEPLIEAILKNLGHRHSYVRRNAVMCIYSIVKHFGLEAVPTAAEQIEKLLQTEEDLTTKRNAFLFLVQFATKRAVQYVLQQQQQCADATGGGVWSGSGDIFQLVLLQLLRKVCRQKQQQKAGLLKLIIALLPSAPPAVAYEGACSLLQLSRSPAAIRAAAAALSLLLCGNSDNNVKLIVLDRLQDCVRRSSKTAMQEFVVDILRGLQTPSLEVRRKTLDLALQIVEPAVSLQQLMATLKRELIRTSEPGQLSVPGTMEYRRLLTKALHFCCSRYPQAAQGVVNVLLDFLSDTDASAATEIAVLLRELVCTCEELRPAILNRLLEVFPDLSHARVLRVCLWILGNYVEQGELADAVLTAMYAACSPLPLTPSPDEVTGSDESGDKSGSSSGKEGDVGGGAGKQQQGVTMKVVTRTVILPDGTYGTEDVYEAVDDKRDKQDAAGAAATDAYKGPQGNTALRKLLLRGDFLLASVVAVSSTKLVLRSSEVLYRQLLEEYQQRCEHLQRCLRSRKYNSSSQYNSRRSSSSKKRNDIRLLLVQNQAFAAAGGAAAAVDESDAEEDALLGNKLPAPPVKIHLSTQQKVKTTYLVACLLQFLRTHPAGGPHSDAALRVGQCLRALYSLLDAVDTEKKFLLQWQQRGGRELLRRVLDAAPQADEAFTWTTAGREAAALQQSSRAAPDDLLFFRQLRADRGSALSAAAAAAAMDSSSGGGAGVLVGGGDGQQRDIWGVDAATAAAAAEDEWYYTVDSATAAAGEQQREAEEADDVDETAADLELVLGGNLGVGGISCKDEASLFQLRLAKVQPMTGQADPVYVEAFLQVNQFDLVVELLLINRTHETLQNVAVELSTHGDLKLVERPAPLTLAAGAEVTLTASIKVRSTETGIIFGYVTFNRRGRATEKESLVLNELHVDLLDYIERRWIGELAFRTMWAEFEWENKIHISTAFTDVAEFLEHLMRQTNLTVVGVKPASSSAAAAGGGGAAADADALLPLGGGGEGGRYTTAGGECGLNNTGAGIGGGGGGGGITGGTDDDESDSYLQAVRRIPMLRKLSEDSSFFAVNLYSRSIFGEDALVNVSIEKLPGGKLAGSIRIRSRTQGIALSLGDRITVVQRGLSR